MGESGHMDQQSHLNLKTQILGQVMGGVGKKESIKCEQEETLKESTVEKNQGNQKQK